ncbi:MAG: pseudaminic acid synthase [Sphingobacteriales bacterium]|nr:pseudaminic acid synthase [Sphingobacteriales bacterium]MCC7222973.1 pseudaminic acid synthase [Chitinophagales bacterium]
MTTFRIAHLPIGQQYPPFVIAEMSGNHNQSLDRALAIVDAAAAAGAHALKLQTYTADTITMKGVHRIEDPNSLWYGKELHDLYRLAYTPWEWHAPIFERARQHGMVAFSTPFDETAVDFLETLDVPAYKIASFENTHLPLLRRVAQTGKPVIVSTGVATLADIAEAVDVLRQNGCPHIALLKCTSTYPASPENSNIKTIPYLSDIHQCVAGISDHTMGIGVSIAAVALGARIIEKHFCLSRAEGGVDSAFSLEPHELKDLINETERAFWSLGTVQMGIQPAEQASLAYKRSIFVAQDIAEGELLSPQNLQIIRPADGLAPRYWDLVLGKPARKNLQRGMPLRWDDLL